jgi:hypothetical protein
MYPNWDNAQSIVRSLIKREISDLESIDMVRWVKFAAGDEQINANFCILPIWSNRLSLG